MCNGDAGNPMMYYSMGKWYLFGLSSFGEVNETTFFCDNKYPSFFQIVPKFVNSSNQVSFPGKWIQLNSDNSFMKSTSNKIKTILLSFSIVYISHFLYRFNSLT